jgi:hypothetical protein
MGIEGASNRTSRIIYANAKTSPDRRGTEMSKAADQPSTNTLNGVVDLLVEHGIKLDALEQVLKETNPVAHELYLGWIQNLQAQNASEVNRLRTQTLPSKPAKR